MRQDTREQIFEFLQDYQRQNGFAPTVREICAGVGLRSPSTVHYHLNALRQAGRIGGQTERARAITLPTARSGQVPVVGTVTAGQPILAVEQIEGYLPWEGEPACFALHVRGDSMVGAAILDGDLVVVHHSPRRTPGKSWWRCWTTRPRSSGCRGKTARSGCCRKTRIMRPLTGETL